MSATRETMKGYYSAAFSSPTGAKVLEDIMDHCGVGKELWAIDQLQQNANVVRHDVFVWIKEMTEE